ncbi:MAG TPA: hypothetical protein VF057_10170, partial [Thermoanaerobaculia bacterium]
LGTLVEEAMRLLDTSATLFFLETVARFEHPAYRFASGSRNALRFDARQSWTWLIAVAAIHRSQFRAAQISALHMTPKEERAVWLSPAALPRDTVTVCH